MHQALSKLSVLIKWVYIYQLIFLLRRSEWSICYGIMNTDQRSLPPVRTHVREEQHLLHTTSLHAGPRLTKISQVTQVDATAPILNNTLAQFCLFLLSTHFFPCRLTPFTCTFFEASIQVFPFRASLAPCCDKAYHKHYSFSALFYLCIIDNIINTFVCLCYKNWALS